MKERNRKEKDRKEGRKKERKKERKEKGWDTWINNDGQETIFKTIFDF